MIDSEKITERTVWNPSPEEFEAYQKREIDMARLNIAYLMKRQVPNIKGVKHRITSDDTLHSPMTFAIAMLASPVNGEMGAT